MRFIFSLTALYIILCVRAYFWHLLNFFSSMVGQLDLQDFVYLMSDDYDVVIRAFVDYLWRAHKLRRDLLDGL